MKRISKTAAAAILGCAERQIQRYAAKGKLTVEYNQQGKIKVATYSEAEVHALKQQLAEPELRGIVQPTTSLAPTTDHRPPPTNILTLPPQALQVLQMLGATSGIEAGKCVSVEEIKFDRMSVGADGATRMSGVSVSRYSARA